MDDGLTKPIAGIPSSAEIRKSLTEEGRPVCVAFSGGKDCIAAELALREAGVETVLAHLYLIPGSEHGKTLRFVEDGLSRLEDQLGKEIHRYPHPSFYRMLNNLVFQPPERCAVIESAQLPTVDYESMWELIREDLGLPNDTWVADGVRAADSIVRRGSIKRHGAMKPKHHKVSPIWDWKQGKVFDFISDHGIDLPVDYEWFGRSFDGIDYRFLSKIKENSPSDFEQILSWFPLADLELMRYGI